MLLEWSLLHYSHENSKQSLVVSFSERRRIKDVENSTVGFFCVLFILRLYYFHLYGWVWIGAPQVKGPAGVRVVRLSQSWGYSGCEPPDVGAGVRSSSSLVCVYLPCRELTRRAQ